MRRGALLLALWGSACQVNEPDIILPSGDAGVDAPSQVFADTLVAVTVDMDPFVCTENLATGCGPLSTGACDAMMGGAALGPPDGAGFILPANGVIELGFRCDWITLHGASGGTPEADFRIYAEGAADARATVEVSYDGGAFMTVTPATGINVGPGQTDFSLTRTSGTPLTAARFVRISDSTRQGGLSIDAVEAL